jgi:hypothetical protein
MLIAGNFSPTRFKGFVPGTVYVREGADPGEGVALACPVTRCSNGEQLPPTTVWLGQKLGQVRSAWIDADLDPGETWAVDVGQGTVIKPTLPSVPAAVMADPAGTHLPTINGVPLSLVHDDTGRMVQQDGCAIRAHWRGRVGVMTWADLFVAWVPTEPWARIELVLNTANPTVGSTAESFPNGFELRIGNALVGWYGQRFGRVLHGDAIAQGQARAFPGVCYWPHLGNEEKAEMALSMLVGSPMAIDQRLRDVVAGMGVPERQSNFNVRALVARTYPDALQAAWRWRNGPLGPAPQSGITGAQEDQCYGARGTECFGTAIENVIAGCTRYLTALDLFKRPCHWREADGRLLDFEAHPQLVFWSGGPHWNPGVSPDRLGLVSMPTDFERNGWGGPDRQHWFYGSLWLASMITGSRALQFQLEAQARLVWFGETTRPNLSTSGPDAARSVGWFGILAVALWCCLKDRAIAWRVRRRAEERVRLVYVPKLNRTTRPEVWDPRRDDRLSSGLGMHFEDIVLPDGNTIARSDTLPPNALSYRRVYHWPNAWMPYQQALGVGGLQIMGEAFDLPEARQLAMQGALALVDYCYTPDPERGCKEWEVMGIPDGGGALPPEEMANGRGARGTGSFRFFWMPLAAWTVLRNEPTHQRALSIYERLRSEAATGDGVQSFVPPVDRPVTVPTA